MCRVLKISKSTYYQSIHHPLDSHHVVNDELLVQIRAIHEESGEKIFALLKQEGYSKSSDCVRRILRQAGICSNYKWRI